MSLGAMRSSMTQGQGIMIANALSDKERALWMRTGGPPTTCPSGDERKAGPKPRDQDTQGDGHYPAATSKRFARTLSTSSPPGA